MNETRLFELRQSSGFVREAGVALAHGYLPKAVRYAKMATRGLYFLRGLMAGRGLPVNTAGLARALDNLWDNIDGALEPAPVADPAELLELLAEGVRVLRLRDGLDLAEEAVFERARNQMTALLAHYDIRELRR